MCKYPEIDVGLIGQDGNAFAILDRVAAALRRGGVEKSEIEEFHKVATSGDYDNLLRTCMDWVNTT